MIYIGIDPDVKLSGVAFYDNVKKEFFVSSVSFFDLLEWLKQIHELKNIDLIRVEAGWLNKKTNWHKSYYNKSKGKMIHNNELVNERISKYTGANHEVGKKIIEMCNYLNIKTELVIPKKSKCTPDFFSKLTGVKRSNQDQRDAGMLVFGM
jgi:hypothetical protein